ncbi:MAG: heparinase II/III-family protein, partial [Planctomycetes bacterium]|nr:heparinase II/III-family protein [Planctomycetota bacterium]
WYARQVAGDRDLDSLLSPMLLFDRVVGEQGSESPEPALGDDFLQARAFRDVGVVSMHTDLAATQDNLMVAFRSSPFGSYNHMHSDQNSFHILFGGRRLFAGSGYYIAYGDEHFKNWYTHTRAHNSILIDGQGQVRGPNGYGWIARYLHGRQISYCTGDASNAYGDAGLTRFRRHVALLRPGIVVVYDELEADHPAKWSWLLHSPGEMTADADRQRLSAGVDTARAQVALFGTGPLQLAVSDQFDPPAVNWRKRTSSGKVIEYANQWHATAAPKVDLKKARFLAIIQIHGGESRRSPAAPVAGPNGAVRVADWRITAQLDPSQDASLLIERTDGKAALSVDQRTAKVGGTEYELSGSESLLVEDAGKLVQRCEDELPEAAR